MRKPLITLSLIVTSTACAAVHTTSQARADVAPAHYSRVLVFAQTADLRSRIRAESSFVRAGRASGVDVMPSSALFLSGDTPSEAEIDAEMRSHHIAAVLFLTETAVAPTTIATPSATATGTQTCGFWALNGQCAEYNTSVSVQQQEPVQYQNRFQIESQLFDVTDGRIAWVGSTQLKRFALTTGQMVDKLADDVVATLVRQGIVATTGVGLAQANHP